MKELQWWINRALIKLKKHRGKCTRKLKITNQKERNYYQIGKVFRTQKVISATIDDSGQDDTQIDKDANFVLHIFSIEGKQIDEFIARDSLIDQKMGKTLLFCSGTEFLVCKRE